MDSFILLRILRYLTIKDHISVLLTCRQYYLCQQEVVEKNPQFKIIHSLNRLKNQLKDLDKLTKENRLFYSNHTICYEIGQDINRSLKTVNRNLYIQKKYNKHFYNRKNDLIFTIEDHDLSQFYPQWKCVTHPIDLHLYKRTEQKGQKRSAYFQFDDDPLLKEFFEDDLENYANVDNIGDDLLNNIKTKYFNVIEKTYRRESKSYVVKLFIWFKPKKLMPPNDTHFTSIVEKNQIRKKLVEFKVRDDYLYRVDLDDEENENQKVEIELFHRCEWKDKWNQMWPVYDLHYLSECE